MKMKIQLLGLLVLFTILSINAQVGIGTNSPDLSAKLEIKSSDKGLLIPKVSLSNVTTTMLDGTNVAATGLMIYNTNSSVIGGNGVGFYSFNGTVWIKFLVSNFSMISTYGAVNYSTVSGIIPYWETFTLDTEEFDTNSEFDITTNIFTVVTSGYYQVTAQFVTHSSTAVSTGEFGVGVFKNGSLTPIAESTEHKTISGIIQRQVTKLIYLTATDYLEFKIHDGGNILVIDAFSGKTFVTINRVR